MKLSALLFSILFSIMLIINGAIAQAGSNVENEITAIGYGRPPGDGSMIMARRAAMLDAQRNLLEQIKGVQIDSETVMEDFIVASDIVHTQVSGLVRGAVIIEEGETTDGNYCIKIGIPLYGRANSLAAIAIPALTAGLSQEPLPLGNKNGLPEKDVSNLQSAAYTGVIIDASAMGLLPTFSPVIYDENGRGIYGIRNIDRDLAISQGMVEYSENLQEAAGGNSRAGDNPLVLKAISAQGGKNSVNKVNVVISANDGDKILLANERTGFLQRCAVVFIK